MIKIDIFDDGVDALDRLVGSNSKLVPEKGGYIIVKSNGVRYEIDASISKCECESRRDCYHMKAARLIRLVTGI